MSSGKCIEVPGDLWFPDPGDVGTANKAVAICRTCPVAGFCAEYAKKNRIDFGIWGGQPARHRRAA